MAYMEAATLYAVGAAIGLVSCCGSTWAAWKAFADSDAVLGNAWAVSACAFFYGAVSSFGAYAALTQ